MNTVFRFYKRSYAMLFILFFTLCMMGCNDESKGFLFNETDSFKEARPIWPSGRETEKNLTVSFRHVLQVDEMQPAYLRVTASTNYRAYVNGKFVSHGPCVAAHDYYRVDSYEISDYLELGDNIVAIEVSGYNEPSYYLLDQPSFLQAEIEKGGAVVASTGSTDDFSAYILNQRKADVPRYSYQRPFIETYRLSPDYDQWRKSVLWDGQKEACEVLPAKNLLSRGVPYPDYSIEKSLCLSDSVYAFSHNTTGFLGCAVKVKEPSTLILYFDELLKGNDVDHNRLGTKSFVTYELQPGDYALESFEPYTMKYVKVKVDGDCDVLNLYIRNYVNSDVHRAEFNSSDEGINFLFNVARETARQNALDVFMDCPSRERAGWLCDSFFASRVAFDFSGYTWIERNFFQNFLLPEHFKNIPDGMLPMCYPSDHADKNFIPNWAMWFVLELEEYRERSMDDATVEALKSKVYGLINYLKPFKNSDGLLEKLDKWVFIEWSEANSFVQDVNYPTNMLYAAMLDAAANLYNDSSLKEEASHVREVIRQQSYDGQFFCDHATREGDKLKVEKDQTEVCQYYAFYFDVATPDSHPDLWNRLLKEFGPSRKTVNLYPSIYFANAFVGNYMRLELLSRYNYVQQLMDESLDEYTIMAKTTGTLWENMGAYASCNHGFASHLAHVFYRDILGVRSISKSKKEITVRFTDLKLSHCNGKLPIGEEYLVISWEKRNNKLYYKVQPPKGYKVIIQNNSGCELSELV